MKIAITGSTGLIGSALVSWFAQKDAEHRDAQRHYDILRLVRTPTFRDFRFPFIQWDPLTRHIETSSLENSDAVIHLAGENVAKGRWTQKRKSHIRDSRVQGTAFLSETLSNLKNPPKVFLSASAYGYYGSRPNEKIDESSPPGTGFLASVSQEWEKATAAAEAKGIRVVHMRIGMVLSTRGGALARMLPLFKIGLGGKVGTGHQMISWISIDDIPRIIYHILTHTELSGPVNFTAPNPVSNKEFVKTLGKLLRRPSFFPLPAFIAKILMGEMAEELLLSSACVLPRKLQESGYQFLYPDLQSTLRKLLSHPY